MRPNEITLTAIWLISSSNLYIVVNQDWLKRCKENLSSYSGNKEKENVYPNDNNENNVQSPQDGNYWE